MTLKQQEKLFCLAIMSTLKIDEAQAVMTRYLELRDTEEGKVGLERIERMTEQKQEVSIKQIEHLDRIRKDKPINEE